MSYSVEHINKLIYSVCPPPTNEYNVIQANINAYSLSALERAYSVIPRPLIYSAEFFKRPTYLLGSVPVLSENIYRPESSVGCTIELENYGLPGEKELFWELVNDADTVISSGSQMTGIIKKWEVLQIGITGITAPVDYQHFRIRIKITSTGAWYESPYVYSLPVDLNLNSLSRDLAQYPLNGSITSVLNVTNEGFEGSKIIIWEVINTDDQSVLSSGSQSSGLIGDFATANINLTGIIAPSFGCTFAIRARIGSDPWIYSQNSVVLPVNLTVNSVSRNTLNYAPGSSIQCQANLTNAGFAGSELLTWELVKASDLSVISSGSQNSGNIGDFATLSVSITGISVPSYYGEFKLRVHSPSDSWVYSDSFYVLPVNLVITAIDSWNDFWWPEYPITPVKAYISNSGFAGSETIEWQVIKYSDSSVISSGTQSSGNVGDFGTTMVLLEGIFSPTPLNTVFRIRARIVGDPDWVNSNWVMQNFIPEPPPNPTPRQ